MIAFLGDGTDLDRATLRVNGNAWQFRHANIQDQLFRHARLTIYRRRVDAGDGAVVWELVRLLREQGNLDEAIAVLHRHADTGDEDVRLELAGLLREQTNQDELRCRGRASNAWATAGGDLIGIDNSK